MVLHQAAGPPSQQVGRQQSGPSCVQSRGPKQRCGLPFPGPQRETRHQPQSGTALRLAAKGRASTPDHRSPGRSVAPLLERPRPVVADRPEPGSSADRRQLPADAGAASIGPSRWDHPAGGCRGQPAHDLPALAMRPSEQSLPALVAAWARRPAAGKGLGMGQSVPSAGCPRPPTRPGASPAGLMFDHHQFGYGPVAAVVELPEGPTAPAATGLSKGREEIARWQCLPGKGVGHPGD